VHSLVATVLLFVVGVQPKPVKVERVEINQTGGIKQIILWTYELTGGEYRERVADWWLIKEPPAVEYQDGWRVIRSNGVEFRTKRLQRTITPKDPELADRDYLPVEYRVPYFPHLMYSQMP